ncbi:MAG TPA: glycosyltransferase family 2 protein [Terriglobales bacterium]
MQSESVMQTTAEPREVGPAKPSVVVPISVIVAARNEAKNLPRCLKSLDGVGEVYVIDSQSSDETVEVARAAGAKVVQFHYHGGWPKKRQWALDTLPLTYEWVLLLDADEALTPELQTELQRAMGNGDCNGYAISLQMHFLGRELRHSGAKFQKLSFFRRNKGRYECRLKEQDVSMCDMEVHEHVVVEGKIGTLKAPLLHHNVESLSRYIQKHNEYSNWEARVWAVGEASYRDLPPALFGTQAQQRRWLRKKLLALPGSPFLFFMYRYVLRLGFLDGIPGLIYCAMQGIQFFHIKAKIYESKHSVELTQCAE